MKLLGALIAILTGVGVLFWVKRRRFERTNGAGIEQFTSYSSKLMATSVEKLAWGAAITCIVIGGFLVL
jgi:hypothetical protein